MSAPIDGIPEALRMDQPPPIVQGITWNLGAWVDSKELMCPHCYLDRLWDHQLNKLGQREFLTVSPTTLECGLCGHVWNVSQRGVMDYLHYVLCGKDPSPYFAPLRVIARYYSEGADG